MKAAHAERRARWEASEAKAFRDLQEACHHGDARDVYRAFSVSRRRSDWAAAVVPFAEEIDSVGVCHGRLVACDVTHLAQKLEAVRQAEYSAPAATVLPRLNPATADQGHGRR